MRWMTHAALAFAGLVAGAPAAAAWATRRTPPAEFWVPAAGPVGRERRIVHRMFRLDGWRLDMRRAERLRGRAVAGGPVSIGSGKQSFATLVVRGPASLVALHRAAGRTDPPVVYFFTGAVATVADGDWCQYRAAT